MFAGSARDLFTRSLGSSRRRAPFWQFCCLKPSSAFSWSESSSFRSPPCRRAPKRLKAPKAPKLSRSETFVLEPRRPCSSILSLSETFPDSSQSRVSREPAQLTGHQATKGPAIRHFQRSVGRSISITPRNLKATPPDGACFLLLLDFSTYSPRIARTDKPWNKKKQADRNR